MMMDAIPTQDVREIIHLLGQVAVQDGDLPFKRRLLVDGLGKLVQADYWFWLQFGKAGALLDPNSWRWAAIAHGSVGR